ncbi:MAG: tetratricopeptide repeat protein [Desulfovibrio sp.]|jgi:cytochrome c-type biogenesis protein CcmH/NrfG|nr:tetratricopeptide repeat protein [Desulfovibrio sp.]
MTESARAVPPFLLLIALLSLLAMFAASFQAFLPVPMPHGKSDASSGAAPDGPAPLSLGAMPDAGPELALSEQTADTVTALMRKIQANPNDAAALTELGDIFLMAGDWNRAELFLGRAIISKPADIRSRSMLGLALYKQGRMAEAAKTFEELIAVEENAAALFNLAIIYKYQLDKGAQADELLEKLLTLTNVDVDTVEKAKKELGRD